MGARVSIVVSMSLDFAECDRARLARDPVYDGRFYTGVHTTGIYCRPVCPVAPRPIRQCFVLPVGRGG
jgi:methylphosphotriester-DNA--protein-cysteine methyltransferase